MCPVVLSMEFITELSGFMDLAVTKIPSNPIRKSLVIQYENPIVVNILEAAKRLLSVPVKKKNQSHQK